MYEYDIKKYDGKIVPDSLGECEYEEIARVILTECKKVGKITSIDRKKIEDSVPYHSVYIDGLIAEGYLTENGDKLYPTGKLLKNQKIPKIN